MLSQTKKKRLITVVWQNTATSLCTIIQHLCKAVLRQATNRYVQGYESASKRALVISIAFGLMSQPIKFRFNSLQTTAVVPEPK